MWYLKPIHPHVIIDPNANYSYLIAHCLVVLCLVIDYVYSAGASIHACKQSSRHVVGLEAFWPYPMSFCLHYVRDPSKSLHKEVHLTLHLSRMKTNLCGRLQSVLTLISKFWLLFCSIAYGYNFKYFFPFLHVNKIMSQLQSPPNLMLLPPHIKSAT